MIQHLLIFFLALGAGLLLTPAARAAGERLGAMDHCDGFRKTHGRPVPRFGGIAIFFSFWFALIAGILLTGLEESTAVFQGPLLLSFGALACMILLVGMVDDIYGLRARWKFLAQLAAAVSMYAAGFRIMSVSLPFIETLHLGVFAAPVTIFWFLGCMNAINLIDGLDGLAGGVTLWATAAVFAAALILGNNTGALFAAAFAGALLGFLRYNFNPASIFLGDSGSYLIGFLLGTIALKGTHQGQYTYALLVPAVALTVPIADTSLAILRRVVRSLPLSAADRKHLHHCLRDRGISHRGTVLLIYIFCIILAGAALLTLSGHDIFSTAVVLSVGTASAVLAHALEASEMPYIYRKIRNTFRRRKRCRESRTSVEITIEKFNHACDLENLWDIFTESASELELHSATLVLNGKEAGPLRAEKPELSQLHWNRNGGAPMASESIRWSAIFPLRCNGTLRGQLEISSESEDCCIDAAIQPMLQDLTEAMGKNLCRLEESKGESPQISYGKEKMLKDCTAQDA